MVEQTVLVIIIIILKLTGCSQEKNLSPNDLCYLALNSGRYDGFLFYVILDSARSKKKI